MSKNYNKEGPRKRSFKTTLKIYLNAIQILGQKGLKTIIKLLKSETLNSKYRRGPRALKNRVHRFCYLTVSRKEAKKQKWGYSRKRGRSGLSKDKVA